MKCIVQFVEKDSEEKINMYVKMIFKLIFKRKFNNVILMNQIDFCFIF